MNINVYVCCYMHITAITRKRGHELEKEQGRVYGSVWKEERKGRMM